MNGSYEVTFLPGMYNLTHEPVLAVQNLIFNTLEGDATVHVLKLKAPLTPSAKIQCSASHQKRNYSFPSFSLSLANSPFLSLK